MPLTAGSRLGVYEIIAPLGAGGMGEVYKARDTKLGRDVALKILPEAFAEDLDRLARFQRGAQTLASLNHPNIPAIYGFEDTEGPRALVLELVDGPTLADRIAAGPLTLDETLYIATQIAEALDAAHELGIIHRDLKPANIKLRPDGTVKLLDFGLAKMIAPVRVGVFTDGEGPSDTEEHGSSQAVTSPAMTAAGIILGTIAYMSPEQARGRAVDKRADVWSFGAVLYEMITGRMAFPGDDVSDILATVLTFDPNWDLLPVDTPPSIRRLLKRCDGRWLAYDSFETGVFEVYVQRFPELGEKHALSIGTGYEPRWSRDGREIFYLRSLPTAAVMRVAFQTAADGRTPVIGKPEVFADVAANRREGVFNRSYDVTADGQIVMIGRTGNPPPSIARRQINVVLNWDQELKQRVPAR